jgi:hypothetical protein
VCWYLFGDGFVFDMSMDSFQILTHEAVLGCNAIAMAIPFCDASDECWRAKCPVANSKGKVATLEMSAEDRQRRSADGWAGSDGGADGAAVADDAADYFGRGNVSTGQLFAYDHPPVDQGHRGGVDHGVQHPFSNVVPIDDARPHVVERDVGLLLSFFFLFFLVCCGVFSANFDSFPISTPPFASGTSTEHRTSNTYHQSLRIPATNHQPPTTNHQPPTTNIQM